MWSQAFDNPGSSAKTVVVQKRHATEPLLPSSSYSSSQASSRVSSILKSPYVIIACLAVVACCVGVVAFVSHNGFYLSSSFTDNMTDSSMEMAMHESKLRGVHVIMHQSVLDYNNDDGDEHHLVDTKENQVSRLLWDFKAAQHIESGEDYDSITVSLFRGSHEHDLEMLRDIADAHSKGEAVVLLSSTSAFKSAVLDHLNIPIRDEANQDVVADNADDETLSSHPSHYLSVFIAPFKDSKGHGTIRIIDFAVSQAKLHEDSKSSPIDNNVEFDAQEHVPVFHHVESEQSTDGFVDIVLDFARSCMNTDDKESCRQHFSSVGGDYDSMVPDMYQNATPMYKGFVLSNYYGIRISVTANGTPYSQTVSSLMNYRLYVYKTLNPDEYVLVSFSDGLHSINSMFDWAGLKGYFLSRAVSQIGGRPSSGSNPTLFRWKFSQPATKNGHHQVTSSTSTTDTQSLSLSLGFSKKDGPSGSGTVSFSHSTTVAYSVSTDIRDLEVIERSSAEVGAWDYHMSYPVNSLTSNFNNFPQTWNNWFSNWSTVKDLPALSTGSAQTHHSMAWEGDPSLKASDGSLWISMAGRLDLEVYLVGYVRASDGVHLKMYITGYSMLKPWGINIACVDHVL